MRIGQRRVGSYAFDRGSQVSLLSQSVVISHRLFRHSIPMSTTPYPPRRDETATADLTRSRHSGTSIGASAADVAVREGTGTSLSTGAILLRQSRLRAAALGLFVWWGLILLQVLLAGRTWIEPAAVVLTLGAASVLLSRAGRSARPGCGHWNSRSSP